ncbi:efflux RND transporter periplasmic adaptor subunit [Microvirga arsenatis]|uniref:Efflux RND transporter periplasmic adaptor subunit n=1 Tax=Microvirga arsenatis TaxID=2692265 RepID=A0ABW9Z838_9HYPH|nr:efflux RND transporter periplasmic adaptor subunit [Microvirga arsenatis]NBJ13593.1 efflux RND transporter periplasmic adaptor subunit [Microvirga arsenatis]NBJ27066.1 efflux RND transporter periplasmic adaptor subunit [Microvirga arsenatis]
MRVVILAIVAGLGIVLGSLMPPVTHAVRTAVSAVPLPLLAQLGAPAGDPAELETGHGGDKDAHGQDTHGAEAKHAGDDGHGSGEAEAPEGVILMAPERIEAARIDVAPVDEGTLVRRLSVPGTIIPDPDRVARIPAKVIGTVVELNKRLGAPVAKGEVVAILESREVAEAKSEYLAAQVNFDLQKTLFEREQSLFQKNISAEQQFLRARTAFTEAQLRLDLTRQKLSALGVGENEVAGLSKANIQGLQRYEIRAPLAGRIVERKVDLGAPVGGEGQEKELYVVADLATVWIELSVSTGDLPQIRDGQSVTITTGTDAHQGSPGRIIFISPILNPDTRTARVIAAIDNKDLTWRPGSYVTAQITTEEQPVSLRIPRTALQTVEGEQVVFVRTAQGFEKREVVLGKGDDEAVEVVFGLDPGETIAVGNSFVLKAELGKAEAEHAH